MNILDWLSGVLIGFVIGMAGCLVFMVASKTDRKLDEEDDDIHR